MKSCCRRIGHIFTRCALLTFGVALVAQAEVYRWTDAQGNVYFSDQPHAGAKQIELKPTTIVPAQPLPPTHAEPAPGTGQPVTAYESVMVTAPANDSTLRGQQDVAVDVSTVPELQPGHQIVLYVDGSALGGPTTSPHFTLPAVDRGSHQLAAAILDENGIELLRSATTTFHLHKNSVADPAPANPLSNPPPKSKPAPAK